MTLNTGIAVTTLCAGQAEGAVFALSEPLSFWGGLDSSTGRIIDQWHPQKGEVVSGSILAMKAGRGSSSGSSVLAEAIRLGKGPAGIVLLSRDAIVIVGAMIAAELYNIACPVVLAAEKDWAAIRQAARIELNADASGGSLTISA
ncbi:aconitase X swivel domain-containing protein [Pararhizobium sp.]|uniref:aconitase X swivel domain-containing protein n=1 Tax=Pararhizobium sp. TaxID=1977563 RepID=UPI0027187444|nr:DUF126 domain-containing protein [Pararhizobium sp.]MDO9415263.1 DUF126 domain-containing protein [Pararhizobium sp.]